MCMANAVYRACVLLSASCAVSCGEVAKCHSVEYARCDKPEMMSEIPAVVGSSYIQKFRGRREDNHAISMRATGTSSSPHTLLWDPETLTSVKQSLVSGNESKVEAWMTSSLSQLEKAAAKRLNLPAELRDGVPAGPWSVTQNPVEKPMADAKNFVSYKTYAWPCNFTCKDAKEQWPEASNLQGKDCSYWENSTNECGDDGMPWVGHDGFANPGASLDGSLLIVMADTLEIFTLAWWFSGNQTYASKAMDVFRAWFVNESTRMNPHLEYAGMLPGGERVPSVITPSFRWNSKLNDAIALLQMQDSDGWTSHDEATWVQWRDDWLEWFDTSEAGIKAANSFGNHASWYFVHKLAMAYSAGRSDLGVAIANGIRATFPGSYVEQIEPSGEMLQETVRVAGVSYSLMNLEALTSLGIMVQRACEDWDCKSVFNWTEESEPEAGVGWDKYENQTVTNCKHIENIKPLSLQECQEVCINECTAVQYRDTRESCSLKECSGNVTFEEDSRQIWDVYVRQLSRAGGRGSLKQAISYMQQYANGSRTWESDHNSTMSSTINFNTLAEVMRMAAVGFPGAPTYEDAILELDSRLAEGRDWLNLLFPPP